MEDLIAELGYVAIFFGTFLEGETILALGGLAAAYGYLTFPYVVGVAALGAFLGYLAGQALEHWIGRLRHLQIALLMALVLAATIAWLLIQWRRR
jgi:membrane protein DedA with SNARE-associated domain